jgi:hypothetical protein
MTSRPIVKDVGATKVETILNNKSNTNSDVTLGLYIFKGQQTDFRATSTLFNELFV